MVGIYQSGSALPHLLYYQHKIQRIVLFKCLIVDGPMDKSKLSDKDKRLFEKHYSQDIKPDE